MSAKRRLRSTCASAQSGQSSQDIQWVGKDSKRFHAESEDSGQPMQMRRLFFVFAERICSLIEKPVPRLIAQENKYSKKFSYFIVKLYVVCNH